MSEYLTIKKEDLEKLIEDAATEGFDLGKQLQSDIERFKRNHINPNYYNQYLTKLEGN